MKIPLLLGFTMIGSLLIGFSQEENPTFRSPDTEENSPSIRRFYTLSSEFEESTQLPRPYTKGDTIYINADKVYPVNEKRFQFYQDMHYFIRDSADPKIVRALINNYEIALDYQKESFDSLVHYSVKVDSLVDSLNRFSELSLNQVRANQAEVSDSLQNMSKHLSEVHKSLDQTEKYIKKGRLWTKIALVGAAIGGFLIGTFTD